MRSWCALVVAGAVLVHAGSSAAHETGCLRDARTLHVLTLFQAAGASEQELVAMVQSDDVFRHSAGNVVHRLALLRRVYHPEIRLAGQSLMSCPMPVPQEPAPPS